MMTLAAPGYCTSLLLEGAEKNLQKGKPNDYVTRASRPRIWKECPRTIWPLMTKNDIISPQYTIYLAIRLVSWKMSAILWLFTSVKK